VLGNSELPHRSATRSFSEGVAWLAQIGLFVMLGLLLSPSRITWSVIGIAVVGSLALTFVARPVSVWVSAVGQRMPRQELAFVSWAGLRGAVPIVLATIPFAEKVTDAERLFDIVFVIVVISTVLTGPTLPWVAQRLGVTRQLEPRSLDLEVAPLERVAADMLQVTISPVSQLHGVEVGELRLPEGSLVSMVVRDGRAIVPERRTVLRRGDDLLVVTPRGQREPTVARLRTVSEFGRLGRWLD
jgi:cell volume regulation protein A